MVVSLPADATDVSATTTKGTCLAQGATVTCTVGLLEQATGVDIVVSAVHPTDGTLEVLASASGDQPDPNLASNELRYTVKVEETTDLTMTA